MKKSSQGFTLTELIVVISILAILATISFVAIGAYFSRTRDSTRIGDLAMYAKSLDVGYLSMGSYPIPDNGFAVTFSGAGVWNQGTVGDGVMTRFRMNNG